MRTILANLESKQVGMALMEYVERRKVTGITGITPFNGSFRLYFTCDGKLQARVEMEIPDEELHGG